MRLTFDLKLRSNFDLKRTRKFKILFCIIKQLYTLFTYKIKIKFSSINPDHAIKNDRNMKNCNFLHYFPYFHNIKNANVCVHCRII